MSLRRELALFAALVCAAPVVAGAAETAPQVNVIRAGSEEILSAVRGSGAKVVVLNMWATWCIPCREEFPDLLRLRERYADRGVKLILVSGDFDTTLPEVKSFLAERGVSETFLKTGNDTEFINAFEGLANLATKAGVERTGRFRVDTPLIQLSKAEIIRQGLELGVDFSLTHSCYDPDAQGRPCGRCDSCRLRIKGFEEAGVPDPLLP